MRRRTFSKGEVEKAFQPEFQHSILSDQNTIAKQTSTSYA
jgi:hypothetical protein